MAILATAILAAAPATHAADVTFPILVPLTGVLSIEGTSQRNGALLAVKQAPAGFTVAAPVSDTGQSPEVAVNAFEKAIGSGPVTAIGASMFGPQILALVPLGQESKLPLITVSGTGKITEMGSPYIFRFFPADPVAKAAHARYVVEMLGRKRVALIVQTTPYGQSGRPLLNENFKKLGATVVFDEAIDTTVKDMLPLLSKARQANPDVLVLHLHAPSTALLIKQAAAMNLNLRSSPARRCTSPARGAARARRAQGRVRRERFVADLRRRSRDRRIPGAIPASLQHRARRLRAGQYDGTMMVLDALAKGAATGEAVAKALSSSSYKGVAMTYKSDGHGNMAHSAVILCYDGQTRLPKIVKHYDNIDGVL
ncbi:MAG: ABC transporter substrate-binding protein [Pseudomonadota bacterium]